MEKLLPKDIQIFARNKPLVSNQPMAAVNKTQDYSFFVSSHHSWNVLKPEVLSLTK
jgi:hypothetical protein